MLILLLAAAGAVGTVPVMAPALPGSAPEAALAGGAQKAAESTPTAPGVIKAEAKLVLVDVIATDKKGNHIQDLEVKDFRVFEDDEEQPITSFSQVSSAKSPAGPGQAHYIVLFFDNSTMAPADQMRARQAAAQFVQKAAGSDRLVAVVDFGGILRIAQNFTANADLLTRAMAGTKFSAVQPNERGQTTQIASLAATNPIQVRSDFAARSVLLAIRSLSKTLRTVSGRKTLIMFSGGFPLNPERESELTATIDAANKSNVAIYAVDVRGLMGLGTSGNSDFTGSDRQFPGTPPGAELRESPFLHDPRLLAALGGALAFTPQQGGGGGGAGGGGGGAGGGGGDAGGRGGAGGGGGAGGPGGGAGGAGGGAGGGPGGGSRGDPVGGPTGNTGRGNFDPSGNRGGDRFGNQPGFPTNPNRSIIPPLMESVATNQQVLHALAVGTGGFTIFNTNDFAAGLTKISKDLDDYYVLGYVPPSQIHDGNYHRIRVKVERKGISLRARNGYFDTKSQDLLAGRPEGKVLEQRAADSAPGDFSVSLTAPYFYTSANVARINLTLDIPGSALSFEKEKGKFHSEINVLGIAYREDNSVGARFSDTVKLDVEKKELKELAKASYSYQNAFNVGPGKYNLKVVLSAGGEKFGKYETPLTIEPFNGKVFHLSGVALTDKLVPTSKLTARLESTLLEERTPLVVRGVQIIPSANNKFSRDGKVGLYVEVYEPAPVAKNSVLVGILYSIVDRKTNKQVFDSNTIPVNDFVEEGNPVIPVLVKVPVNDLQAGQYRVEVRARDSSGNVSPLHAAEFAVE